MMDGSEHYRVMRKRTTMIMESGTHASTIGAQKRVLQGCEGKWAKTLDSYGAGTDT